MNTFLNRVATHILSLHQHELDRLTIVFPNRRAGLYLRKELALQAAKTIWLPKILSIEDAFATWSDFNQADNMSIVFDLLEIYLDENKEKENDAGSFAGYALQMARDFDEIDHYLVDPQSLFKYLSESKAIELWHPDGSPLTVYEKNYLSFFNSLHGLHEKLSVKMREKKTAYSGFIASSLARKTTEELLQIIGNGKLIFAGFNALTPAEEQVITKLTSEGIATVLWDLDEFYIKENRFGLHEAGASIRKFNQKYPGLQKQWTGTYLLEKEKIVHIIGVPGNIGQAKAMGNYLQSSNPENITKTAVVLADEKLLIPVLNSIPDEIGKFNVTMGLSFIYSAVYQFIIKLFEISIHQYFSHNSLYFPLRPLCTILQHEILVSLLPEESANKYQRLGSQLIADGSAFVKADRIKILTAEFNISEKDFLTLLLGTEQKPYQELEKINRIFVSIFSFDVNNESKKNQVLLHNQIQIAIRLINRIQMLLQDRSLQFDLSGLMKLFVHIAPSYTTNFYGEPLEGLQIMGMLETRNLDFDCIHLLSANETILPAEKGYQSLIPNDIRKSFNLPTYIEKQAVYAFHFFRMLQYVSDIYIYYNTEPDELGGGEMSRFLLQLRFELAKLNPKIRIKEELFTFSIPAQKPTQEIIIEKTPQVLELIAKKAEKGISPTSLSRYVNCSLQFFLQDVLSISETKKAETSIGLNVLGTVVHKTLEKLFAPFLNSLLKPEHLKLIQQKIKETLIITFNEEFPGGYLDEGRNKIAFAVAEQFIKQTFDYELSIVEKVSNELVILFQEVQLETNFEVQGRTVKLKGTIDRIDRLNNALRIVDYKTGLVKNTDVEIKEWEELLNPKKSKALQLAVYLLLYIKNNENEAIEFPQSGLLSLRKISQGLMKLKLPDSYEPEKQTEVIMKSIQSVFEEIFNSSISIQQTEMEENCKLCSFKELCRR